MSMIQIRPLTQGDDVLFTQYMSGISFSHEPNWAGCYCRFYHSDVSTEDWIKTTPDENREEAQKEIRAGRMNGYLAFDGETCVGWCNAGSIDSYVRVRDMLAAHSAGKKAAAIMCFVIRPEYRGRGLARQLLSYAVSDLEESGYTRIIAMPFANPDHPEKRYRGTMNMYLERGFSPIGGSESVSILALDIP